MTDRFDHLNIRFMTMVGSAENLLFTAESDLDSARTTLNQLRAQRLEKVLDFPPVNIAVNRCLKKMLECSAVSVVHGGRQLLEAE